MAVTIEGACMRSNRENESDQRDPGEKEIAKHCLGSSGKANKWHAVLWLCLSPSPVHISLGPDDKRSRSVFDGPNFYGGIMRLGATGD